MLRGWKIHVDEGVVVADIVADETLVMTTGPSVPVRAQTYGDSFMHIIDSGSGWGEQMSVNYASEVAIHLPSGSHLFSFG